MTSFEDILNNPENDNNVNFIKAASQEELLHFRMIGLTEEEFVPFVKRCEQVGLWVPDEMKRHAKDLESQHSN